MEDEAAAHHLLNVIEERELNVDLDSVLAAFEDESTKKDLAAWVNEHLNEETLLTKEELELYETLKRKGLLQQFEDDDVPLRPVLDHELASAIDSLQSSTAAIEEQCRVLEAQKDALSKLKALDKPNLSVEHMRNERRRRENQEKARLDIAVEDVSTSITEQLTDTQKDLDAEKTALKTYMTERLASDDKILTALPAIVSKVVTEPEVSEDEKLIEQWCKAIVSFRTAEVKARVDAVYIESLNKPVPENLKDTPENELRERKEALQAELETLHTEITSVADMVVEHEIGKPMNDIKERKERDKVHARTAWLKYILSTLDFMSKRLNTIASHTKDVDEFQQALTHIGEAALQRMPGPHADTSSPTRKRATSGPRSAFSPALKLKPTKSLDLPPAIADALRHAGVSFNVDSIESLQETLINTQVERETKLSEHYVSSTTSTQEILAARLGKADLDVRAIFDALYLHTPFKEVHLVNPKLEEQMKATEKELENADRSLLELESSEMNFGKLALKGFR
ncbi:hypothetical protein BDV96DRAFT_655271 [Lophiotrema nucula]|uniref:Uncharacterized protein n=1 Tax=Lophiotrema nucula TaxID=690887 RepID=A0A6A5YHI5_9PLEO|nr:hypothetical protein BDV96DRAFT_655271 [Lophiotrema nucula]